MHTVIPSQPLQAPVAPMYIGPANCEHVIGWSWRFTRDWARAHAVEVLRAGSKPLIRLAELQAAIERESARNAPAANPAPESLDDMRRRLGFRRTEGA